MASESVGRSLYVEYCARSDVAEPCVYDHTDTQSSIRLPMVPHHIILCSCFDTYGLCTAALHQTEAQISPF